MNFENYGKRILVLNDYDFCEKPKADTKQVSRLTIIDGEMQQRTVTKTRFPQFNDKRFYFSDGITSLPVPHPYLQYSNNYKKKKVKVRKNISARKRQIA